MYKSYLLQKTHLERYKNELGSVEKLDLKLARFYDRNKTRPRFRVNLVTEKVLETSPSSFSANLWIKLLFGTYCICHSVC